MPYIHCSLHRAAKQNTISCSSEVFSFFFYVLWKAFGSKGIAIRAVSTIVFIEKQSRVQIFFFCHILFKAFGLRGIIIDINTGYHRHRYDGFHRAV